MSNEETQDIDLEINEEAVEETATEETVEEETTDWKAEALKYKAILDRNKKKPQPITNTPKIEEDLAKDIQELKLAEKKRQFGYQHQLSPEETDKLFRFAGNGDPADTLKDSFFQAALKESRRLAKVADATPSSSSKSIKVEGKNFSEMTPEERAKNWDKVVKR